MPLFKGQSFEFNFETPITIIAGANGSGKSTFLEAIARRLPSYYRHSLTIINGVS